MKGKKIEAAKSGVDYNAPLANNSKMNIMASAKQRKRGGAVKTAAGMPEGLAAMKRLDKPARKGGGKVGKHSSLHGMDKHSPKRADGGKVGDQDYDTPGQKVRDAVDDANEDGRKNGGRVKRAKGGGVSLDKMAAKTAGKMLSSAEDKPGRKRGGGVTGKVAGKIGVNTHPISTANRERPMKGHTAQPNIT